MMLIAVTAIGTTVIAHIEPVDAKKGSKNPVAECASAARNSTANQCHKLNPHSNSTSP